MRNYWFLFFVFFYWTKDFCVCNSEHTTETPYFPDVKDDDAEWAFTSTEQITTSTTTVSTPSNDLDDISIQDILSSDIDANDEIEQKILQTISEFSSKCNIYTRIELSLNNFVFPNNIINVDLGRASASFYNFTIEGESTATSYEEKSYSTLIGCDSSKIAKIEVSVPNHIKITANVKVNETLDSPNGIISQSVSEGVIIVFFKNNSFLKQFSFQSDKSNFGDDTRTKLSYNRTEIFLDLDTKYQKVIYKNLEIFFNETESVLEQFFVQQLNKNLTNSNISVGQSCSKFINPENNPKKRNARSNSYVISNVSLENWKEVGIESVVVQGLSNFSSIELIVLGTKVFSGSDRDDFYLNEDVDGNKQTTVRIKTNDLEGKLDWRYDLKQKAFSFSIDSIMFEVKKIKNHQANLYNEYNMFSRLNNRRAVENNININVYLGNIQIKSSKSSESEDKIEFSNFVLSKYLQTVLKGTLKNLLTKKLQNNFAQHC